MGGAVSGRVVLVDDVASTGRTIRAAMDDVEPGVRGDASFLAKVLVALLAQARLEYDEALDGGAFVADHEYHDSWGFVQIGRDLLDRHADTFRGVDADAYEQLLADYEAVMEAWPQPTVPEAPPLSVSELFGRVSTFEFTASQF